ncbi:MAG: PEGA domain-containing protein [Myxococcota bacterium]|nr:PEGA domain-containing protein [Myxococcota bacterium]
MKPSPITPINLGRYVVILALLGPITALSQNSVVVLPLESEASDNATQDLNDQLKNAIERQLLRPVRANIEFSLDEARVTFDCDEENARCMAETGRMFRTPLLFWGSVRGYGPFVLSLSGLDVARESISYSITVQFETVAAMAKAMDDVVKSLINGTEYRPRDRLTAITSEPADANVFLNGELIGQTPLSYNLVNREGSRLVIKKGRYTTASRTIEDPYGDVPIHFVLERVPIFQSEESESDVEDQGLRRPAWPLVLAITGSAAGAIGLGVGSYYGLENQRLEKEMQANIASQASNADKRSVDLVLRQDFEQSQLMANISFGIGAAALIAGAYGFYEYLKNPEATVLVEADRLLFEVRF